MAVRTIIPGPPGTGKTYRLVNHYLSNEINGLQTNAQRIIYITFSKAAAKEARERIETLFPNQDFLYISTMHSLGTRECGINTSERLLNGKKKWNLFKIILTTKLTETCHLKLPQMRLVIKDIKILTCR